ncbi:MAG: response regulator [Pegethrix bostrychoides GSE-TBD4-15B]|jgi:twitching motility two-component system response regulator PilH|uniref:Response regulator n=1 Tax=Pegethrix bostrychoides GSE-TBD4-15B TaxID=2839662 RepID=A0A951PBC0_9CYAN|nr:response regulator [Pegethrix bostrychoides GSE-TBD4-15B]
MNILKQSSRESGVITVLIVEDTPSERELLGHYLRQGGYQVIDAENAKEGFDRALLQRPDVIVTDIVMPGMSGFELCRSLKRHPETAEVPVVICSSKDQYVDRLWGLKQGATIYMTKPFTREELIHAIQSLVR